MTRPTGKPVAVVTGATSGIGYELGKQFAQHGFDLVIAAADAGSNAARAFKNLGAAVATVQADLTSWEGVETLYRAIGATERAVDLLALTAGVGIGGFAHGGSPGDAIALINHYVGIERLSKLLVPDMVARGSGRILFVSPVIAARPRSREAVAREAVFVAPTAYVHSFMGALRTYVQTTGVTVTALHMAATDTDMLRRGPMHESTSGAGTQVYLTGVARQSYAATMAGKDQVIAGAATRKATRAATIVGQATR